MQAYVYGHKNAIATIKLGISGCVAIMIHRVDVDVNMLGCANKLCAQQTPLVHTDVLFMRRIHARPAQAARGILGGGGMAKAINIILFPPLGACAHFGACADQGRGVFRLEP